LSDLYVNKKKKDINITNKSDKNGPDTRAAGNKKSKTAEIFKYL